MAAQSDDPDFNKKKEKVSKKASKRAAKRIQNIEIQISSEDEEADDTYHIVDELQAKKKNGDRLTEMTNHYASEAVMDSQGNSLSTQEENRLVRSFMRFMLFRHMQKPGIPVKRDELSKLIPSTYRSQRIHALGKTIAMKAQASFPRLFGMEMKEVNAAKSGQGTDKAYVLRSLLAHSLRNTIRSKELEHNQALLMVILPLILLAGGKLPEDDLNMHLKKIGVDIKDNHPTLGKVPDALQLLTQKRYLAESKENGPEGSYKVYAVGTLAVDEIKEDQVKGFMDAVFKKTARITA